MAGVSSSASSASFLLLTVEMSAVQEPTGIGHADEWCRRTVLTTGYHTAVSRHAAFTNRHGTFCAT